MDTKALFNLSYGVFLLSTKSGEKINACITNTAMQVANSPTRIAISSISTNYTCDLIKESGFFALTVLDTNCTFDFIKDFGYQSGRNVNKFENYEPKFDENGCPYISEYGCSLISCKVVDSIDLGTHTLFIAEVLDAKIINKTKPITYSDYQNNIKPKPQTEQKKIVGWRCVICGYEYEGETLPDDFECPICGHPKSDFEPIYEK